MKTNIEKNLDTQQKLYILYINEHIFNVHLIWKTLRPHLKGKFWLDDYAYLNIHTLIEAHDASKFKPEEFEGYRQNFFPEGTEEKLPEPFDLAWNHHQKTNPHHWEYWVLIKKNKLKPLSIPFRYLIEMLCDWASMSFKFKNIPSVWYEEHKDNMLLHPSTITAIQTWIPLFDKVVAELTNQKINNNETKTSFFYSFNCLSSYCMQPVETKQ